MRRNILLGLSVTALTAAAALGHADTLLIEGLSTEAEDSRPERGMTMQRVESSYGPPSRQAAAVGEPPITRWVYPSFTVYFEHDRVIHAVARR